MAEYVTKQEVADGSRVTRSQASENAAFIAAARSAMPRLLQELQEVTAERDRLLARNGLLEVLAAWAYERGSLSGPSIEAIARWMGLWPEGYDWRADRSGQGWIAIRRGIEAELQAAAERGRALAGVDS